MEDLLQVGVITQPHGVRGEVKVFPTTDDVKRFKKLKKVLLDTGKETSGQLAPIFLTRGQRAAALKASEAMSEDLRCQIGLPQLAELAGVSPASLKKVFFSVSKSLITFICSLLILNPNFSTGYCRPIPKYFK